MQQLIPPDVFKQQKPKEWQKAVTSAFASYKGLVADDAKVEFLRTIQQWPTFGSAFFEVKQTTEPNYPELILVAINRRGVHIIHPVTKVRFKNFVFQIALVSSQKTFLPSRQHRC